LFLRITLHRDAYEPGDFDLFLALLSDLHHSKVAERDALRKEGAEADKGIPC
jgi:hypothetical protein